MLLVSRENSTIKLLPALKILGFLQPVADVVHSASRLGVTQRQSLHPDAFGVLHLYFIAALHKCVEQIRKSRRTWLVVVLVPLHEPRPK